MNREDYLDKTVLIGANYLDDQDEIIEQRQFVGVIERVDDVEGIIVRLRNGGTFKLPPYLNALQPAEPGDYTLQSTLEIVRDPDFLTVWSMRGNDEEK